MSVTAICPTCRTPHKGSVEPGSKLVCGECMEEFVAGSSKAAGALSLEDQRPAPAVPVAAPAPAAERPRASTTSKTTGAPRSTGRAVPRPQARERDEDGDGDEAPRRERSNGSHAVAFVALGAVLVLLAVCIGGGIWLFNRANEAREREQAARANVIAKAKNDAANPAPPLPIAAPPAFGEPPNPYKAGTQIKLREVRAVPMPELRAAPDGGRPGNSPAPIYQQIVHSPKHKLLFVSTPHKVSVYDLAADKTIGTREAKDLFTDMSLAPDQGALFVADYGGTRVGYGTPIKPSHVHRFDPVARRWEDRQAPKIAYRIEAVDPFRVLLLEQDQRVSVTLNKWETDGAGVRELARTESNFHGDMEYDPRTGRIYHGNSGSSSHEISVRVLEGNTIGHVQTTATSGAANKGGSVVLSQDGSRFYYGSLQVNAADVTKNLQTFPEIIFAASRDVAFGSPTYYHAATGSKLGAFPFRPAAITVSPDGASVWVIDGGKNVARQFALEDDE
jgi:hypothetical protein